jgi:hypothetical protein
VGFNSWFSALPAILKILVIFGIVLGSFAVGTSFIVSAFRIWKFFAPRFLRRDKDDGSNDDPSS